MMGRWTEEDYKILRDLFPDHPTSDLAKRLNRTYSSVAQKAAKLGLRKSDKYLEVNVYTISGGEGTQFRPGQSPWNKGKKGWMSGGRSFETQFKRGHLGGIAERQIKPVGHEIVNKDGVLVRKVKDKGARREKWRPVHVLIWEKHNGPVPSGCIVRFANGNKRDFSLSNLELVTREENMRRNSVQRFPTELRLAIQMKGVLNRQIRKRMKE